MYVFPEEARRAIEAMPVPLAYYQQDPEKRITTLLVTDGLCRMMQCDREPLTALLNGGLFNRVHPDDVGRLTRIVGEFAQRRCGYDVIYRSRYSPEGDYHTIHSIGRIQAMPDGEELAVILYIDISESRSENSLLAENYELFRRDHFYTDPVTGLPNSNYLHEFSGEALEKLRSDGKAAALAYFDVRRLRSYNNQYGYARGDDLLCQVADVLKDVFPGAMVTRGADDHFVVITEYLDEADMHRRIDDANTRIKAGAYGNTLGIQAGLCVYGPSMDTATALEHARHAHKQIGHDLNRLIAFYTHETDEQYWNQQYILESFDTALSQSWIKIYYQAIMRVQTGRAAALEALARWVDPVRGIISPAEFIPVLEKHHLLYRLDLYMVEQFLKELPDRAQAGLPIIPVSINFSAQDFDHVDIVGALNALFEHYGADKDSIIVEITEQELAAATDRFREQLAALRDNGYRLWLDDFGSGYSSLNVLSQYDVDVLKFDLEFLRHLDDHDGANRHIMRYTVELAKKLGIRSLAEGMETEEHLRFLREIGCEFAQGFYYYKPESLASILFKMERGSPIITCEQPEERRALRNAWIAARDATP